MREDQLLQRFAADKSAANGVRAADAEAAFAELVHRYLDFVYCICRRKVGSRELAQDITQTVFLLLAAKAGSLKPGTVLSGWLFQTAHLACQNALRTEARRQRHEREAMREQEQEMEQGRQWEQIEPALDDALAQLSPPDRDAILLRFVQELTPEEMAIALGISAAAAQKRVSRALERLRRSLPQTGATLSLAVISVILTDKMVQAAPPSLGNSILAAASQAVPSPAASGSAPGSLLGGHLAAGRPAVLTKTQGILAACLLGVAGVAVFVFVSAASHHASGIAQTTIGPQATAAAQAASAMQRTTVRGSVVSGAGNPAANAAVTILHFSPSQGAWSKFAGTRTDSAGQYAASGLSEPGQPEQWAVIADSGSQLGFGVPNTPCVLLPPTQIRLHLVGNGGQPLAGVDIQPLLLSGRGPQGQPEAVSLALSCPPRLVARTDSAGNARLGGLPQGFVATFMVQDLAYERRPPAADGLPLALKADSGQYTVPVALGASVTGRLVYGASSLPATGVRIGAQEAATSAWGEAQTDAQGRYQIRQLSPGRYTVAVDEQSAALGGGWTAAAVPAIALGPGQKRSGADMELVPGVLVSGKVTRRRRPVAGTEIGVYGPAHPASGAWVGGGWTQADGTYQIRVPPGPQHVYPMAGGSAGADIVVQDGQKAVVNFALP